MTWQCEHCGAVHEGEDSKTFGDLTLAKNSRRLQKGTKHIELTRIQEDIMLDLMRGRPTSQEALVMRHAGEDTQNATMKTHIHRLKHLLLQLQSEVKIHTLHGFGWELEYNASEYNQKRFGDITFDFDRRVLIKDDKIATLNPKTLDAAKILLSGELEPLDKFRALVTGRDEESIKHNAKSQITYLRRALKSIGASVEIVNYEARGYQMRMGS